MVILCLLGASANCAPQDNSVDEMNKPGCGLLDRLTS